jgi:GAF domain-containing protein
MDNNMQALEDVLAQFNEENDSNMITRYSRLVKAIEFFSQRFSLENMDLYIYQFTLELLKVKACGYFHLENDIYTVYDGEGLTSKKYTFPMEEKHNQLVYFHAGLMSKDFIKEFVNADIVTDLKPDYGIPLIMDKTLYGFFLINNGGDKLAKEEEIIAEALMNLYSLSLTNYKSYNALERVKRDLDSKIFNLFAINQASKALLSELNTDHLIELSLSVFSELTQSRVTGIYIYDQLSNSYDSMGIIDVYNKKSSRPTRLLANQQKHKSVKVVIRYDEPEEIAGFAKYFDGDISALDYNEPEYIICLINEGDLRGFVTISSRVNGEAYDMGTFELIESLASSTYVAIMNAKYIEKISSQQRIIEDKFKRLQELNRLVKNMNTATSIDNLLDLTLETLKVSFGYRTSFVALYNRKDQYFDIHKHLNFQLETSTFKLTEYVHELKDGKMIIRYRQDDVASILSEIYTDELYDKVQGMIMIPIVIEEMDNHLMGVICLMDVNEGVLSTNENILTLETIANHIAPHIKHLEVLDHIQKSYIKNSPREFIQDLEEAYNNADETDTEVYVVIAKEKGPRLFGEPMQSQFAEAFTNSYSLNPWVTGFIARSKASYEKIVNHLGFTFEFVDFCYPTAVDSIDELQCSLEEYIGR